MEKEIETGTKRNGERHRGGKDRIKTKVRKEKRKLGRTKGGRKRRRKER